MNNKDLIDEVRILRKYLSECKNKYDILKGRFDQQQEEKKDLLIRFLTFLRANGEELMLARDYVYIDEFLKESR